jgi:hypothetical protein
VATASLAGGRGGTADEDLCNVETAESPVDVAVEWVRRRRPSSMWWRRPQAAAWLTWATLSLLANCWAGLNIIILIFFPLSAFCWAVGPNLDRSIITVASNHTSPLSCVVKGTIKQAVNIF